MQYALTKINASCPVCYNSSAVLYWRTDSVTASRNFVSKRIHPERFASLVKQIEKLWNSQSCDVVECMDCTYVYSYPYVAGDKIFYDLAYERTGYPKWKWEFQEAFDVLSCLRIPQLKILEVAAGDGAFVKRILNKLTSAENILTTEYSSYGKKEIGSLGITCLAKDIRSITEDLYKNYFDAICMFQVLEHMDNLDKLFSHIRFLLKNAGHLIVAVPNNLRIEFNEKNGGLLDMPPNHIGRWNKRCFEVIAKRHGFFIKNHKFEDTSFFLAAKQLALYRFLRFSQKDGSVESIIVGLKNRIFRGIMHRFAVGVHVCLVFPVLLKTRHSIPGDSQIVHFVKS